MMIRADRYEKLFETMISQQIVHMLSNDGEYRQERYKRMADMSEFGWYFAPHNDCNTFEDNKVKIEPENTAEYRKCLGLIEKRLRQLVDCHGFIASLEHSLRTDIAEISKHIAVDYDVEKLRRTANYYFKHVRIVKDHLQAKDEDCEKDLSYFYEVMSKVLGKKQMYELVDVWYDCSEEGIELHFTIPQVLGYFELNLPFPTEYKPSVDNYCGKFSEDSGLPLEATISYSNPGTRSYYTIAHGWTLDELGSSWKKVDLNKLREQYLSNKVTHKVGDMEITETVGPDDLKKRIELALSLHEFDMPKHSIEADKSMRLKWQYCGEPV